MMPTASRRTSVLATIVMAVALGCGQDNTVSPSIPLAGAAPDVVLSAFLEALRLRDCPTAEALATTEFIPTTEQWCSAIRVAAYLAPGEPAHPAAGETVYPVELTTTGQASGRYNGTRMWFFTLRRPSGDWRIADLGTGP
jgi:hypothetical protein